MDTVAVGTFPVISLGGTSFQLFARPEISVNLECGKAASRENPAQPSSLSVLEKHERGLGRTLLQIWL